MIGRVHNAVVLVLFSLFVPSLGQLASSIGAHVRQPRQHRISVNNSNHLISSNSFELATNPLAALELRRLHVRQGTDCPDGFGSCRDHPTDCCPVGGVCCVDTGSNTVGGMYCILVFLICMNLFTLQAVVRRDNFVTQTGVVETGRQDVEGRRAAREELNVAMVCT